MLPPYSPTTYKNLSGKAVQGCFCQFYKIPLKEALYSRMSCDIPPGTAKLKKGGGQWWSQRIKRHYC